MKISFVKAKKPIYLFFLYCIVIFLMAGCRDENNQISTLKVVNSVTDDAFITEVKLIGYDFSNLNITKGTSQSFSLEQGMSGGYENINVQVFYKRTSATPVFSKNISLSSSIYMVSKLIFLYSKIIFRLSEKDLISKAFLFKRIVLIFNSSINFLSMINNFGRISIIQ